MHDLLSAEKQKIEMSARQLQYRRINWRIETKPRISTAFNEVVAELGRVHTIG